MKKILVLITTILVIAATACTERGDYYSSANNYKGVLEEVAVSEEAEYMSVPVPEQPPAADVRFASNNADAIERKVIKTAELNIQVKNLDSAKLNIDEIVRRYNAYVSTDNRNNDHYKLTLEMTIRVQQDQLEPMLQKLLAQAYYVHYNNISAQDVTEEFVDLNIRLKNKKAVEEQYVKLLQKATKVEDILKIENELRMIREEIESKEGRLKYLQSQVSMSTIHLRAYQDIYEVSKAPAKSFWLKITDGFAGGWELLKNIMIGLIHGWPLVLGAVLVWILIRNRYRKYRMKKAGGS